MVQVMVFFKEVLYEGSVSVEQQQFALKIGDIILKHVFVFNH